MNVPKAYLFILPMLIAIYSSLLITNDAQAQELLANRSFEAPVAPSLGNNFYSTIPGWGVINVAPANPVAFNIIRPHAGYANNPTSTPVSGGVQYLDINSAAGTITQSITVSAPGMISISGWFSVRDFPQALSGLIIQLRNSSNVIVASANTSFTASDPIGLWKQARSNYVPISAGAYTLEVVIPNFANFDLASARFDPPITVSKSSAIFRDPYNITNPKAIPGGTVDYTIAVSSPASYALTNNSIAIIDTTPAQLALVVSSPPVAQFNAGSSGLSYTYSGLASASDNIDFSNNGGASWSYVPVAGANGSDPAVTDVRIRPSGSMAPNGNFNLILRYLIK